MSILFINGSPNKNGNTAKLAKELVQSDRVSSEEKICILSYRVLLRRNGSWKPAISPCRALRDCMDLTIRE